MARSADPKDSTAHLGFEAKLWLTADKLRNNMDAAEYKHVVLGLIFLKYISDTFEEHRAKLLAGADPVRWGAELDPADAGKLALAVVEQGVDHRSIIISGGRMDDHSGGLIDDEQMIILEHDLNRDVLRFIVRNRRRRHGDAERRAFLGLGRRISGELAATGHLTGGNQRL